LEHPSSSYPPRTKVNVQESDGTLIVGNAESRGSKLTLNHAKALGKPSFEMTWRSGAPLPGIPERTRFYNWLIQQRIGVLNVAGNRESKQPGIEAFTVWLLTTTLADAVHREPVRLLSQSPMPRWRAPLQAGVPTAAIVDVGAPHLDTVTLQEDGSVLLSACSVPGGCEVSVDKVHPPEAFPWLAARWSAALGEGN